MDWASFVGRSLPIEMVNHLADFGQSIPSKNSFAVFLQYETLIRWDQSFKLFEEQLSMFVASASSFGSPVFRKQLQTLHVLGHDFREGQEHLPFLGLVGIYLPPFC